MAESVTDRDLPVQSARISDLTTALVALGFACLLAGILSAALSGALLGTEADAGRAASVASFLWAGLLLAQLLSYTPYVEQGLPRSYPLRTLCFGLSFTLSLALAALPALLGLELPSPVSAFAWLVLGGTGGLLLPVWGNAWTALDGEQADSRSMALAVAWATVATVALCVFTVFAPPLVSTVATWCFFMASVVLAAHCTRAMPAYRLIEVQVSKAHLNILSRDLSVPAVFTLVFGATLCRRFVGQGAAAAFVDLLVAAGTAALAMVLVLLALRHTPRQSTLDRWVTAVVGLALALPVFGGTGLDGIAGTLILAALVFYMISHFNVLVALSYRHKVLTLYHYAQGLIAPLGGIALGWALMAVLLANGLLGPQNLWQASMAFLLLILLIACLVPFASNRNLGTIFEKEPEDAGSEAFALSDDASGPRRHTSVGYWQQRMRLVSEACGLSPREMEVFALLAKGRNAEHISKSLFISTHTVKTHIYRIYRKLEVNTQQELIDRIEQQPTGPGR
ncbi:MAG: helix-turn-helix transcriptional regulator [Coriobacteriales bacterium]|jgi:DNA-binding CsgD family transcriptional regulator|nr:helix-turn-helix transcriptional regulator [Coriobacteriales bacterium]